ncbi:hypothetical protein BRC81_13875 [Halobacteriales archaeon QS_1_68_20]|nr:MAG: hypothetical protein BRC81_13875 [Halobacteriales archaeon QS_1_68_20]
MPDPETLADRLDAVERVLTDGETDLAAVEDAADVADRLDALEERIAAVERQVADLEAATQALRGYVGNVKAVNDEVERRADLALARGETLERLLEAELERLLEADGIGEPFRTDDSHLAESTDASLADGTAAQPVDPSAGEGWRDAAAKIDPDDIGATGDDGPSTDRADESDRPGGLRAVLERLREAS